jgi:mannose-1-phosphate guanylyltransferase/mannose-1-phosphate guanylyltransferase/mannose-6-phosphate isomerase
MQPIVLSGGAGTRLWPVSRASFPKQFNDLVGESLLERTLKRVAPLGAPRIVASADGEVLTRRALDDLGLPADSAVFEPVGRNTAPALALACRLLLAEGRGDEVVGSFPADHLIADEAAFLRAARLAERCARAGQVVTLGIRPTHPATGYGYVEMTADAVLRDDAGKPPLAAYRVRRFLEKPDETTARAFVDAGNYLWNAGMFVFRVDVMARHFERLLPAIWQPLTELRPDLSNLAEIYAELPGESIDVGVMEKLGPEELASIPCSMGWSDVGSWDEVARLREGGRGVFEHGAADNFVYPLRDKVYALVGVDGLVVVDTDDALLVAPKGAGQAVKEMVAQLTDAGRREATEHTFEFRPWGDFEILRDTDRFKSKILHVRPGHRLSYQSHRHRSEHWVIVAGHPEVVLDDVVHQLAPGDHIHIPQGAKHRIRNPGSETVELVEVQLGTYFGEDDIVRYEDDYERT